MDVWDTFHARYDWHEEKKADMEQSRAEHSFCFQVLYLKGKEA